MHMWQFGKTRRARVPLISGLPGGTPPSRAFTSAPRTSSASARRRFVVGPKPGRIRPTAPRSASSSERRVADAVDDDDVERARRAVSGAPTQCPARRGTTPTEREHSEQDEETDRPDHQLSILTEVRP